MRSLAFALFLVAGCGEVKNAGEDGGGGSTERCDPGDALACEGNDLLVCGQDGITREVVECDISCDTDALACTCEPGTVSCQEGIASVCGDNGLATLEPCALGCFDDARCAELDASNRLTQFLDEAVGGPDLVLPDGTIIDTNDQEIIVDGLPINVEPVLLAAPADPGGIPVLVFAVSSLTITGDVIAQGQPALAFVSDGDITVNGILLARAGAGSDGTGGGSTLVVCDPGPPATGHISGRGGGGFGGRGGDGGDITDGPTGGAGGAIVGNPEVIPLRGGGQDPGFVGAGGGLQLVSKTRIAVTDGGAIDAGGVAGLDNGTGGGAGGGVVLEAPVVVVSGAASAIAANGGGGGCGNSGTVTRSAEAGRLDDQRALGCLSDGGGDGGRGGAGATPSGTAGETISGCGVVAGQGGGGVGRIRVSTADGTFAPADGAIVSPPATSAAVGTR